MGFRLVPKEADELAIPPKKQETRRAYILVFLQRQISVPLSYYVFLPFGISPNLLTIISFLVGLYAVYALATGSFLLGAILLMVWGVIDCCDGEVARLMGKSSKLGAVLETLNSDIQYVLWLPALAYGLWTGGMIEVEWVFLAFLGTGLFNVTRSFLGVYPTSIIGEPKGVVMKAIACQFKDMRELRYQNPVFRYTYYAWRNVVAQHGVFEIALLVFAFAYPFYLPHFVMFYALLYLIFASGLAFSIVAVSLKYSL